METKIGEFETTERDGYPNLKGRRDDLDEIRIDRHTDRQRERRNNIETHAERDTKRKIDR